MILKHRLLSLLAFAGTIVSTATAEINLKSDIINFRDQNSANNTTNHYGDLALSGGQAGTSRGYLYCNGASIYGSAHVSNGLSVLNYLTVFGDFGVYGNKNFMHPHPTDSTKVIKYIAIEAGEALTVVRGLSKTVNGTAEIILPEHFTLVTSKQAPLTVIVTPEKSPAALYVKEKSYEKIIIGMKTSDQFEFGDVEFAYQVTGVRDGFEDEEIIVNQDDLGKEKSDNNKNNEVKKRIAKIAEKAKIDAIQKKKNK